MENRFNIWEEETIRIFKEPHHGHFKKDQGPLTGHLSQIHNSDMVTKENIGHNILSLEISIQDPEGSREINQQHGEGSLATAGRVSFLRDSKAGQVLC